MAYIDTSAKFKINENPGAGIVRAGNAVMNLGSKQLQHRKDDEEQEIANATMKINQNKDKRDGEKLNLEKEQEKRIVDNLQTDKEEQKKFKSGTIGMFKKMHPKTTAVLEGDEEKIWAFTKSAGYASLQKGKKLKDTKVAPNNDILYVFDDGSIENSGFKSKDWNQPKRASDDPKMDLTKNGDLSISLQDAADEKRAKRLDKNID